MVNAQTGEIGIDLFSDTPILTTAGGSLVTIAMQVVGSGQWAVGSAELGSGQWAVGSNAGSAASLTPISLVSQVDPTGQRLFTTTVTDTQGTFVLHLNSGQWTVASGSQLTMDQVPAPIADIGAQDSLPTAHCPLPTSALPTAHGPLPTAALPTAHGPLPTVIVDVVFESLSLNDTQLDALAPPWAEDLIGPAEWSVDDNLAYLRQPAGQQPGTIPSLTDDFEMDDAFDVLKIST